MMGEEQALLQRCYRRMRAELGDEELRRAAATMQRATAILKEERERSFPLHSNDYERKTPDSLAGRRCLSFL